MFVRHVNGRAFLAACVRIDGQVRSSGILDLQRRISSSRVNRMAEYNEKRNAPSHVIPDG